MKNKKTSESWKVRNLTNAIQGGIAGFKFIKHELPVLLGNRAACDGLLNTLQESNVSAAMRKDFLAPFFAARVITSSNGAKAFFETALEAVRIASNDPAHAANRIEAEVHEYVKKCRFIANGGRITKDGEVIHAHRL